MPKSLLHPRHWASWLAIGLLRLLAFLPLSWLLFLGQGLGRLLYHVLSGRRNVVEVNTELCFPELQGSQKTEFMQNVFASSIMGFFESFYSWWSNDASLKKRVDYEGLELIEKHQQNDRGILLVGAHFTTLDIAGRLLRFKLDNDVSYRKQNNLVFDYCIFQFRQKTFTNVIEKNEVRRMIKVLRSGRIMWLASDQDFGRKNSSFAPFFGHAAATLNAASRMVAITGAKPLFFSHYRIKDNNGQWRYLLKISDPFNNDLQGDELANATLINQTIEHAIRFAPEQYMWVHRRFKTRPDPMAAKLYQFKHKKKKRRRKTP